MANMPQQSILDSLSWGGAQGQPGLLDGLPPWMRETLAGIQGSMPPNGIALQGYNQFPPSGRPSGGQPQGGGSVPMPQPQQQPEGYYGGSPETNPRLDPATYGNYPAQSMGDRAMGVAGQVGHRLLGAMNGFANAGSLPSAIANGITTLATGKVTDPNEIGQQMLNQKLSAIYGAFRQANVPHAQALAAALNPEVAKMIGSEVFAAPKVVQTGEDMYGGKQFMVQKGGGKFEAIPGSAGGSADATAPGGIDESLRGREYLAQYPKNVQAAVNDYMDGLAQPVGNPRKGFAQVVRTIAQRVGNDIGMPVDEASFAARRKMRVDLNASGNSTMGGIITNGQSAIEHLANLSDKYTALGNRNGPNMPFGAALGEGANYLGNKVLPNSQMKDKVSQANNNALRYGQESTKFYAGSGGGHEERLMALKNNNPEGSTSDQLAGFLQTEKELILGRLHQKELQIKEALGQKYLDDHPVRNKSVGVQLKKIDDNIDKLRGKSVASPSAATGWTYNGVR